MAFAVNEDIAAYRRAKAENAAVENAERDEEIEAFRRCKASSSSNRRIQAAFARNQPALAARAESPPPAYSPPPTYRA